MTRPWRYFDGGLFALFALSTVCIVWTGPFVPTHDGPNHLANCVLADRLLDPSSPLHRFLEVGVAPTNQGFQVLCRPLELALGWRNAYRVLVLFMTLGWGAALAYLVAGVDDRSPLRFLGFASAFSWTFYMGFFNFLIACILAFLVLGWVVRQEELGRRHWLVFAGTLFVTFLVHGFAALLLLGTAGLVVLLRGPPRAAPKTLGALALCALPLLALTAALSSPDSVAEQTIETHLLDAATLFVGGPLWRALPPTLMALIAAIAGVLGALKGTLPRSQRGLALVAAGAAPVFFILPIHLAHWSFFSPRFLIFGLPLAAAAVPPAIFAAPRRRLAGALVGATVSLISLGWSLGHQRAEAAIVEEALAGVDAPLPRKGARLPLMLSGAGDDPTLPHVEPLIMLLHLYLFDQGGVDPYLWATSPALDPILFKQDTKVLFPHAPVRFQKPGLACAGTRPDCPPLEAQYEWYALAGREFEDVILFADDPKAFDVFAARGYVADLRKGRLGILRPGTCRVEVELRAADGAVMPRVVGLDLGRSGLGFSLASRELAGEKVAEGTQASIEGPDCGRLWLTVGPTVGCAEGDAEGRVTFEASVGAPAHVRCTVVQR